MRYFFAVLFALLFSSTFLFAQNEGVQIGSSINQRYQNAGAYYDYSDPSTVNIKVAVWGFVRYPGKYIIPGYSTVNDLLSYAGGPEDAARLQELRLYRTNEDSSQTIINLNYKDIMFDQNDKSTPKPMLLKPGDILLVSGEPRLYFQNVLSIGLSIISTLISIATLVVIIRK